MRLKKILSENINLAVLFENGEIVNNEHVIPTLLKLGREVYSKREASLKNSIQSAIKKQNTMVQKEVDDLTSKSHDIFQRINKNRLIKTQKDFKDNEKSLKIEIKRKEGEIQKINLESSKNFLKKLVNNSELEKQQKELESLRTELKSLKEPTMDEYKEIETKIKSDLERVDNLSLEIVEKRKLPAWLSNYEQILSAIQQNLI